jgi:small subunit ribosomal protein S20e
MADKQKDFGEPAKAHKIRITLTSRKVQALEKVCRELIERANSKQLHVKGPVRLPTKILKVTTRKTPCGEGSKTWDCYELRIHSKFLAPLGSMVASMGVGSADRLLMMCCDRAPDRPARADRDCQVHHHQHRGPGRGRGHHRRLSGWNLLEQLSRALSGRGLGLDRNDRMAGTRFGRRDWNN